MKRAVFVLALAACGSGSGVDGDKRITSLRDDDLHALCNYIAEVNGLRTIDCGSAKISFGEDPDVCFADMVEFQVDHPACEATVDDKEACEEAIGRADEAKICAGDGELPAACAWVLKVECGGS